MNTLLSWLHSSSAERLGWMLVHSLWQLAILAGTYVLVRQLLRRSSAAARYLAACATMVCMVLGLPLTALLIQDRPSLVMPPRATKPPHAFAPAAPLPPLNEVYLTGTAPPQTAAPPPPAPTVTSSGVDWKKGLEALFTAALPWIVALWFVGVFALAARQLGGWLMLRRLCGTGTEPVDEVLAGRLRSISRRLGVQRTVRLLSSVYVVVPSAIGHLKPVILLPASLLSGLSTQQIEALLAHELAHIRRHDYLVNLVQVTCETVLFYHPAVWWLSREIRREREHCCDDLAVQVCGDRISYARTLTLLEEHRFASTTAAMAATGGSLTQRIRRIVGQPVASEAARGTWLAGMLVLGLCLAVPLVLNGAGRQNTNGKESAGTNGQDQLSSPSPDLARLKGAWEIVSVEGNGDFQWQMRKTGDRIYVQNVSLEAAADQTLRDPHYTISPRKTPKEVDATFWLVNLFVTQHGLYQVDGDKLTLCLAPYQEERPKQFAAVPGKSTLFVLKRVAEQPGQHPRGALETGAAGRALETDWSPPTEGVQLRLSAPKLTWQAGEVPTLRWSATNSGTRQYLEVADGERLAQLEVDGVWYQWPPGLRGAALPELPPGKTIQDQHVTLGPVWSRAKKEDLEWRRDGIIEVDPAERDAPLLLKPGKHTIRLAVIVTPSRVDTGDGFRCVSLPMELVVEAPSAGESAAWPPSAEVLDSVKRAISASLLVLQISARPDDPKLPEWIESAVRQATQTEALCAGTALHNPVKGLLDAFVALRKAHAADHAGAREQFDAAIKAHQQLVRVLAGGTSATQSGTQTETLWGDPIDGLQVRLHSPRQEWSKDEFSIFFQTDMRSETEHVFPHYGPPIAEFFLELDGQWYETKDRGAAGAASVGPSPAALRENLHTWITARHWRSLSTGQPMPAFAPGRHTFRIGFPLSDKPDASGQRPRAVSNPVELEIAPNEQRNVQSELGYGDTIQQSIAPDYNSGIDMDAGLVRTLPADPQRDPKSKQPEEWVAALGADLWVSPIDSPPVPVHGLNLAAVRAADSDWDIQPADLVRRLDGVAAKASTLLWDDKAKYPATFLVRTRVGGMGVVQILGNNNAIPTGWNVRYKMLASGPTSEARPAQTEASWGEPVNGLSVRLRPEKRVVQGRGVAEFQLDVRNQSSASLQLGRMFQGCFLEVDGQWYGASVMYDGDLVPPVLLKPGETHFALETLKLVAGTNLNTPGLLWHGSLPGRDGKVPWPIPAAAQTNIHVLNLPSGKHAIRFAYNPTPDKAGYTHLAYNNPVELEVVAVEHSSAQTGDAPKAAASEPRPTADSLEQWLKAIETDWSPPTEGVSLRISAAKRTWPAGEVPALKWAATNSGPRQFLQLADGQRRAQLEVDGIWYWWSPRLPGGGRLLNLSSESAIRDQLVTLGPVWSQAKEENLLWRRDRAGGINSSAPDVPLSLKPGKHTIRLAILADPSRAGTGDGFRVVSLPLEIMVESPSAAQPVNWPPSAELVDSVKRSYSATSIAFQSMGRPNGPSQPGWMESAVRQATETATLSTGTPMHDFAKELLDALVALNKVPAPQPGSVPEQLTAASRANQRLLSVLAGEIPAAPTTTPPETAWGKPVNGLQCRLLPATQKAAPSTGGRGDISVLVTYELRNVGTKRVKFLPWFCPLVEGVSSGVTFKVTDQEGNSVPYRGGAGRRRPPTAESFITIEPGQTLSNQVGLPYDFSKPGSYRITATKTQPNPYSTLQYYYSNAPSKLTENPDNVWTGELISNEVKVDIVPAGDARPRGTNAMMVPAGQETGELVNPVEVEVLATNARGEIHTNAAAAPAFAMASSNDAAALRARALSLLQKHDEYRASLRSYACVEEATSDYQTRLSDPQRAGINGNSTKTYRTEYRTDGTRYSVAMSYWGNIDSPRVFVPEARRLTRYYLWDGKELFANYIDTRLNQAEGLEKLQLPESWELIGRGTAEPAKDPAKADKLTVRARLETVGQSQCYVVDSEANYSDPPHRYTVQETRWLDPERGYNIVKATRVRKNESGFSDSTTLDNVVCRQIDGSWVPMEASRRKAQTFSNGDYMRITSRIRMTTFTLNPDHLALRSFVPHLANGERIALNPKAGQSSTIEQTPIWRDGRVLNSQGTVLLDCTANIDNPSSAGASAATAPIGQPKFAIYLAIGHTNAPHFRSTERGRIIFSEAGDGANRFDAMRPQDYPLEGLLLAAKPLLTDADLIAYNRQRNLMRLKPGVTARFPSPTVSGVPFVVVAEGTPLFLGAFWSGGSSYSANMPTISLDYRLLSGLPTNSPNYLPPDTVRLENRQRRREGELPGDPLQDERLYLALQRSGKLDPDAPSAPLTNSLDDVERFIEHRNVVYTVARKALTIESLPQLYRMLKDPAYAPKWGTVAGAIGCLRQEESIPELLAYLKRRDQWDGLERNEGYFRMNGKIAAMRWIGLIGGKEASAILRSALTESGAAELVRNWGDDPQVSAFFTKEGLPELVGHLRGQAIVGLVLSNDAENRQLAVDSYQKKLAAMRQGEAPTEFFNHAVDAMAIIDYIQDHSIEEYRETIGSDLIVLWPYIDRYNWLPRN